MARTACTTVGWGTALAALLACGCTGTGTYYANTEPTPLQHDTYFPISPNSPGSHFAALQDAGLIAADGTPATALCNTCHDSTSNTSFTQSTCTGCHTNALGQTLSNPNAPGCGPDGGVVSGQSLQCTDQWHATAGVGSAYSDGGLGGYGYLNPDGSDATCVLCHANDEVWRVAQHATRVVGIPFDISAATGVHYEQSCLLCHPNPRNAAQNGHPPEPWATDFSSPNCTTCHLETIANPAYRPMPATDAAHTNPPVPGYAFGPTTCIPCHLTGNK